MNGHVWLRAGELSLSLLPAVGGSIGSFALLGAAEPIDLLRGSDDAISPLDTACFPLVPYCNRIRGGSFTFRGMRVTLTPNMVRDPSPLHGQGWLLPWQVEQAAETSATLSLTHEAAEWPWRYRACQRFDLDARGLTARIECRNEDRAPMPCGLGFHPYFPCTAETRLRTSVDEVWLVDDDILPVGRQPASGSYDLATGPICGRRLDNGYGGWSGEARIERPDAAIAMRLASPDARFFQLYSPRTGGFYAAEPVSHANAALNEPEADWHALGLKVLEPGESMSLVMRLDVAPLG